MVDMIPRVNRQEVRSSGDCRRAEHLSDAVLSRRELEVLRQVAGGPERDIALTAFIAEETVKVHLRHIPDKRGAGDRTQSVTISVRRGIIRQ
jgi:DNA-binding CsgD family transcriptional regulator